MSGTSGAPTTLREFVMRLGFTIDEASQRKWTDGIANMTKVAATLGAAVATAAAGVIAGLDRIAGGMASLQFISERTKSSVGSIEALSYAITQLGGSRPALISFLDEMGKKVTASNGAWGLMVESFTNTPYHDAAQGLEDILTKLREMKAEGADDSTIQAWRNAFEIPDDVFYAGMHPEIGAKIAEGQAKQFGNKDQAAKDALKFEQIIGGLRESANQAAEQLGAALFKSMGSDLTKLQTLIDTHKKEINDAITAIAGGITHAGELIVKFGLDCVKTFGELKGWYDQLTPANKALVETIGGLSFAMAAFKTSPIGAIILGLAAMVELYKDYQKYKAEGSDKDTLLPWTKIQPAIDGLTNIGTVLNDNISKVGGWQGVFEALAVFMTTVWVGKMIGAIARVGAAVNGSAAFSLLRALTPYLGIILGAGAIATIPGDTAPYKDERTPEQIKRDKEQYGDNLPQGGPNLLDRAWRWGLNKFGYDTAAQAKSAREAYDFYIGKGMTPAGAAGMVAQEKAESGFDPGAVGDNGSAMGLYQWHQDRRDRILADYGIDVSKADANTQREAAWLELHNSERNALDEINRAGNDPRAAGAAGSRYFERPGDEFGQAALRGQSAFDYLKQLNVPPPVDVGALLATAPAMAPFSGVAPMQPFETGDTNNTTNHFNLSITGVTDPRVASDRILEELSRGNPDRARNNTSPVH